MRLFPSKSISRFATAATFLAFCLQWTASTWQHVGAASSMAVVNALFGGAVDANVGAASMGLSWLACVLVGVAFLALVVMVSYIDTLDRLQDE